METNIMLMILTTIITFSVIGKVISGIDKKY